MSKRKRTEITVETSLLILRHKRRTAAVYCAQCPVSALLLTPDEAAALAGISTRAIYRWVEDGRLHFLETTEQALLVCLNSLRSLTQKGGDKNVTEQLIDHRNHDESSTNFATNQERNKTYVE